MSHAKQASKRKRRSKAVPMVGIAGVSLAMAGGASAATAPTANLPSQSTAPLHEITFGEEEISDVSLATFYVFDKENAGTPQLGQAKNLQPAAEAAAAEAAGAADEAAEAAAAAAEEVRGRRRLRLLGRLRLRLLFVVGRLPHLLEFEHFPIALTDAGPYGRV